MGLRVKHMIEYFLAEVEIKQIFIYTGEFETDCQVICLIKYIPSVLGTALELGMASNEMCFCFIF